MIIHWLDSCWHLVGSRYIMLVICRCNFNLTLGQRWLSLHLQRWATVVILRFPNGNDLRWANIRPTYECCLGTTTIAVVFVNNFEIKQGKLKNNLLKRKVIRFVKCHSFNIHITYKFTYLI